MRTEIHEFWNCFSFMQMDLILADNNGDAALGAALHNKLEAKVSAIAPRLSLLLVFQINEWGAAKLILLTKGNNKLEVIAKEILKEAPHFEMWYYQRGIEQYNGSITSLCENFNFIDGDTTIYQIYFSVQRIYKSSNKLHLIFYLEMDKKHPRAEIHEAMYFILLYFFGDAFYHRHISRFKIVKRKFSAIHFVPIDELRNVITYKFIN